MSFIFSRSEVARRRRQLIIQSTKDFIRRYMKRKIGVFGLIVMILFVGLALSAPVIAPHDPVSDTYLAEPFAPPEWYSLISRQYANLPKTTFYGMDIGEWKVESLGSLKEYAEVAKDMDENAFIIRYLNPTDAEGNFTFMAEYTFEYPYETLKTFIYRIRLQIQNFYEYDYIANDGLEAKLTMYISKVGKKQFILYDSTFFGNISYMENPLTIYSTNVEVLQLNNLTTFDNLAERVFRGPGRYRVTLALTINDYGGEPGRERKMEVYLQPINLEAKGMVYGLLGTDYLGRDVWSQFVWGSRVSLAVGILVAIIVLFIAIPLGMIAGYKGGVTDRLLISIFDIIYILPVLPIILLVTMMLRRPSLFAIIALIAIFSWTGLARQIRAWTLSLRERPFVESIKVIGASDAYIMFRYILPQMAPLLVYYITVIIPGAILTEAGISLLGLGDPTTTSWGMMIQEAQAGAAILKGAWWWVMPPIAGIILLCMAFIFIGFTLDEIVNPRLRRR